MHTNEQIYTEYIYLRKNEEEKEKIFFAGRFTRVIAECYVVRFLSYLCYLSKDFLELDYICNDP